MEDRSKQAGMNQQGGQNRRKHSDQKKRHKQKNNGRDQNQNRQVEHPSGLMPKKNPVPRKSNIPPVYIPRLMEPLPTCAICGSQIETIANAICGPEADTYSHFDCILEKIKADEHVVPPLTVSYIGRGTFAVIEKNSDGSFTFLKRINYESPESFNAMKRYVEDNKQ